MMGHHCGQKEWFSYGVDLERRVRPDHPLRRVETLVDFTFARAAVAHTYGDNGNVSVDPVVWLKRMFPLFHENVRSERELGLELFHRVIGRGRGVADGWIFIILPRLRGQPRRDSRRKN